MFNLLPKERKRTIKKSYFLNLSAASLFMLGMTGVVTLVFLTPSFFVVRFKESRAQNDLKILEQQTPELKNKEDLESVVREITRKIKVLEPAKILLPSQVIQKIIKNQPNGISVTAFSYQISDEGVSMKIKGIGKTRETLTVFTRNLREDTTFDNVELPVSDLVKDKDIDFSITLIANLENV